MLTRSAADKGDPRRRVAAAMLGGYLLILGLTGWANVASLTADLRGAGVRVVQWHVVVWEGSSLLMWLVLSVAIWRAVAWLRPPRAGWPMAIAAHVVVLVAVSLVHVGGSVALRKLAYALAGDHYVFGDWWERWFYELRKDAATYAQLGAFAAICQWVLGRLASAEPTAQSPTAEAVLAVPDGALVRHLPIGEIDHVAAAGNYVELAWRGQTLLHRATLASVEAELGDRFVRIHRSRLVRRDVIRAVQTAQSGDFEVELASGERLRGSRRFRDALS